MLSNLQSILLYTYILGVLIAFPRIIRGHRKHQRKTGERYTVDDVVVAIALSIVGSWFMLVIASAVFYYQDKFDESSSNISEE